MEAFRAELGMGIHGGLEWNQGMENGIRKMVFRNSKQYSENSKGKNGMKVG